jgi:hypothetical protein
LDRSLCGDLGARCLQRWRPRTVVGLLYVAAPGVVGGLGCIEASTGWVMGHTLGILGAIDVLDRLV